MQYTERLPLPLSTRSLVVPLVTLLVGAAAATGAYALIDNGADESQPSKVIVVEQPAPAGGGVAAKDEAATAAAIATPGIDVRGSKAFAESPQPAPTSGVDLRGSKASASGQGSVQDAAADARTDPHGTAAIVNGTP